MSCEGKEEARGLPKWLHNLERREERERVVKFGSNLWNALFGFGSLFISESREKEREREREREL